MRKIFRSKWMWAALGAVALYLSYDHIKPHVDKMLAKLKGDKQ